MYVTRTRGILKNIAQSDEGLARVKYHLINMKGIILPNFQSEGYINDILYRKIKRYHALCLFSHLGTRFPRVWRVLAWDIPPPPQLC
jgi:hypothetical protein